MQKIDFSKLPKRGNRINWDKSIGLSLPFIYDDISGELNIICKNKNYVTISYGNKQQEIFTGNLLKCKIGCLIDKIYYGFKTTIGDVIKDNRRDLTIIDQKQFVKNQSDGKRNIRYIRYKCNICKYESDFVSESMIVRQNVGCSCCTNHSVVKGINDISTTDPWMVEYFPNKHDAEKYHHYSRDRINFICPDCKKIKTKPICICQLYMEKSIGCGCKDGKSYPEKFISNMFEQMGIEYIWGYSPQWLKGYRNSRGTAQFDFYIPNHNLIVEMDGLLGHGKNLHPKANVSLEDTIDKDLWKDNQAKQNGLTVVRIDSDKSEINYMMHNIKISLSKYFDLNKINWELCDKFATSNFVKTICDYYETNKPITATDISNLFNISLTTICTYLETGKKFGWCNYDKKYAQQKITSATIKRQSKRTEIYKDEICLGVYSSVSELDEKSIIDFGVKLYQSNISQVARGEKKYYKGYKFKYVS